MAMRAADLAARKYRYLPTSATVAAMGRVVQIPDGGVLWARFTAGFSGTTQDRRQPAAFVAGGRSSPRGVD